jgi:hypothetical protein
VVLRGGDETYHNAGLGGFGGSSYIDAMVERFRDMTNGWAGAADGAKEEARYYCQNWRGDASLICTQRRDYTGLTINEE